MSTYKGTVKKNDLEGGFWELVTESGEHHQLQGADSALQVEGQKVEIQGSIESATMGIGMVGSILKVSTWKPA